ncbi:MAG: nitroreductase [Clostridiales Family XIII bacterium]|jgi:nitroreductase|nr:nitroreductase [Clostridiales Family XIII bacterium]
MNAKDLLLTRRSVRKFKDKPVPDHVLEKVLEMATYAPTGMGRQAPQLVVVKDPLIQAQLRKMNAKIMEKDIDPYYGAPLIVLALSPNDVQTYVEDGACVLTYLMLAAHEEGLATVWVHRERQMFASPEGKALLAKWGIPDKFEGIGSVALGYADGDYPKAAPRREDYVITV